MILTSKYDLGQRVHKISRLHETVGTPCAVCGGTGRLALVNGGDVPCTYQYKSPRCDNGKIRTELVFRWTLTESLTVGRIEVRVTAPHQYIDPERDNAVSYMCRETGVGSGPIHYERDLFATRDEALAECAIRNVGCDTSPTEHTVRLAYEADEEWESAHTPTTSAPEVPNDAQ